MSRKQPIAQLDGLRSVVGGSGLVGVGVVSIIDWAARIEFLLENIPLLPELANMTGRIPDWIPLSITLIGLLLICWDIRLWRAKFPPDKRPPKVPIGPILRKSVLGGIVLLILLGIAKALVPAAVPTTSKEAISSPCKNSTGGVENLAIDGFGNAKTGIDIEYAGCPKIRNTRVLGVTQTGINARHAIEPDINNTIVEFAPPFSVGPSKEKKRKIVPKR